MESDKLIDTAIEVYGFECMKGCEYDNRYNIRKAKEALWVAINKLKERLRYNGHEPFCACPSCSPPRIYPPQNVPSSAD